MEIKQFEYLVACAECGSFGKASEMLYTTQANVSKVISKLEDELGYRLFERSSNGVYLTPGGRMAYETAREVLEKTRNLACGQRANEENNLHLASVYDADFPQRFARFIRGRELTESKFGLFIGNTEEVLDSVVCERAEIGLLYYDNLHNNTLTYLLHKNQLEFLTISPAEMYLSVGPNNPLYDCEKLEVEKLHEQEFVCFEDDLLSQKSYHLDLLMRELNIEENLKRAIYTNSDTFMESVLTETDRAYLHYAYYLKDSFDSTMRNLKVEYSYSPVVWGYARKKGREISTLCREFTVGMTDDI